MRTTVDIPDAMYRKLKSTAGQQGCSVKELILRGVEKELNRRRPGGRRIRPPLVRSKQPGRLRLTNEQVYDLVGFP